MGTRLSERAAAIYVVGEGSYWLAHVPALRGCIASGTSRDEAVANARRAFRSYLELLEARGVSTDHWKDLDPDTFDVRDMPSDRIVPEDIGPMEEHEVRDFLHQFEASRAALISLLRDIAPDELERKPTEKMWSVREALEHVMLTEASLLSRLEKWPADPFNTLQAIHRVVFQRFTVMEPADTALDHEVMGRRWTTRKVMRRILEHEFEHLGHIKEIVAALGENRAR